MHKSVEIFGEKLAAIIDSLPFDTHGTIAERTGVERETVSRWKSAGKQKVSATKFPKLAIALGKDPLELLREIGVNGKRSHLSMPKMQIGTEVKSPLRPAAAGGHSEEANKAKKKGK